MDKIPTTHHPGECRTRGLLFFCLAFFSLSAHADWTMATYHGHPYAGAHGGQDGAAKFAVGMLCKQDTGQPVYVLAHRRFVTASGPATTLPAQFEQGELLREFRVDGVHFGDLGARHGSYDADNNLLIFASAVPLSSPVVRALKQGRELDVVYLNKAGEVLYVSDFSLKGSAATLNRLRCP